MIIDVKSPEGREKDPDISAKFDLGSLPLEGSEIVTRPTNVSGFNSKRFFRQEKAAGSSWKSGLFPKNVEIVFGLWALMLCNV